MQVLKRDLEVIAAGEFKNIGLRVSFGELITHWDPATSTPTYNESKVGRSPGNTVLKYLTCAFLVHDSG